MKNFFRKIKEILKGKNWFDKIMFFVAIIFIISMIIIGTIQIGWWTVFTSVAIGIVYDDVKKIKSEFDSIQIEEKEEHNN